MVVSELASKSLDLTIDRIVAAREVARAEILGKAKALRGRVEELEHLRIKVPLTSEEMIELESLGKACRSLADAEAVVVRVVTERLASWDDVRRMIEALELANQELGRKVRDADDVAANVEAVGDMLEALDALARDLIVLLARLA
ncbi:MAG: hypothetical protein FJX54_19435 [Alphaproteobacteria bacterium]|nr:hypothetical protein [Alphaproteobacteria bacterium]